MICTLASHEGLSAAFFQMCFMAPTSWCVRDWVTGDSPGEGVWAGRSLPALPISAFRSQRECLKCYWLPGLSVVMGLHEYFWWALSLGFYP